MRETWDFFNVRISKEMRILNIFVVNTGFTGTCAWVDPVNELVYVFLSNRIYPDVTNRKLNQLHIRERIQGAIYDAMKKK